MGTLSNGHEVQGAIANIADSKGTGIDAAKLLRDTGMSKDDLRRAGATGELARLGIGMRDLPQDVFDMVVAGKLTEKQGAIIGSGGLEPLEFSETLQALR